MRIHPETRRSARFTSRLLFGFALIALGVAVLLHNTDLLDLDTTGRWWPALLIAFGLERLWSRGFLEALSGHLLLVGGTALLLACLGHHLLLERWWPLGLLWIGTILVLRAFRHREAAQDTEEHDSLCQDEEGRPR